MPFRRDPVSELFDGPARRLIERAYAAPGQWQSTRLGDPGPRHIAWAASIGINVLGPDRAPTQSGEHDDARTRWARGYVRSVYYLHRWHFARGRYAPSRRTAPNDGRAIEVEVGSRVRELGVLPAGRIIRVRTRPGGAAALKVVQGKPDSARIYDNAGAPAGRWADPDGRDWA